MAFKRSRVQIPSAPPVASKSNDFQAFTVLTVSNYLTRSQKSYLLNHRKCIYSGSYFLIWINRYFCFLIIVHIAYITSAASYPSLVSALLDSDLGRFPSALFTPFLTPVHT